MAKKHIVAVTGCRSEYDILYSVLRRMEEDEDLELSIIVCGAHLSERFGYTIKIIEQDNFSIAGQICNLIEDDTHLGKAKGTGILIIGLAEKLSELKPDYVMVAGDREETVACGIVCTYLEIPLIHIAGGDKSYPGEESADVDEPIRHATSKMAHIHFTTAKEHAERLGRMGEEPFRVFWSGNPALDRFKEIPRIDKKDLCKFFNISNSSKPLVVVIQHVISSQVDKGALQIQATLEAVSRCDVNCVINYPNSDMGSQKIISVIDEFGKNPQFTVTKNIPRVEFVNLLRHCAVLVGNSSMALLEGPSLGLPAINVGLRQKERLNGGNVVFVDHDKELIYQTLQKILTNSEFRNSLLNSELIYGDGTASEKIVKVIKNNTFSKKRLLAKNITF